MSMLINLVPRFMQKDPLFAAIVEAVGKPFDSWRATVGKLASFLDPAATPEAWLDPLMALVGLPRNDALDPGAKRALIAVALSTWVNKGTEAGIEAYFEAYTGVPVDVFRRNTTSFIAGVNQAGDPCGTLGGGGWAFDVYLTSTSGVTESEVRAVLDPIVAAYEQYDVVYV